MKKFLKTLERIAVAAGLALLFLVALEVLRAYQTLAEMSPVAGYAFLAAVAAFFVYIAWQLRALVTFRKALKPPELPPKGPLQRNRMHAIVQYLERICDRMVENPLLTTRRPDDLTILGREVAKLNDLFEDSDAFRDAVRTLENERIAPLMMELDKEAEGVVSDNVGLVTIGTALAPYRAADFTIVLARNIRMVNRILHIYRTRPTIRETLSVFYDIARVVAAVNLLNAMDNIWAGIGRHMPFVGRYGEAVSEGVFSGLFTSVAGHAAIDRCRSYKPWQPEAAARKYRSRLHRWSRDVFGILVRHGIARFSRRTRKDVKQPAEKKAKKKKEPKEKKSTDKRFLLVGKKKEPPDPSLPRS